MPFTNFILFSFLSLIFNAPSTCSLQFLPEPYSTTLTGLKQFTISYLNFSVDRRILLFGGQIENIPRSQLLEINIEQTPYSVVDLASHYSSATRISSRYGHCSVVVAYKMYVYGGIGQNGTALKDIWEYNWKIGVWIKIGESVDSYQNCNLISHEKYIYILGISNNQLSIQRADLDQANQNYQSLILTYTYASLILAKSKTWLNLTMDCKLPVQLSPSSGVELSQQQFVSSLAASSLYAFAYPLLSPQNDTIMLVTQGKICLLNLTSMQINMLSHFKNVITNIGVLKTVQWLFFIGSNGTHISLKFMADNNFALKGLYYYSNFDVKNTNYKAFAVNDSIYFVSQVSLKVWVLHKSCNSSLMSANVKSCFYEKIDCKQGFYGANCSLKSCSNTLSLYDSLSHQSLLFQCSNHGSCVNQKCVCDEGWLGQDCSRYNRTSCSSNGNTIENWPITNCECKNETIGGNNCEIKFCYNDCSGHGICLLNGECVCDSGFFGEDCSVTIIEFPGASLSLGN